MRLLALPKRHTIKTQRRGSHDDPLDLRARWRNQPQLQEPGFDLACVAGQGHSSFGASGGRAARLSAARLASSMG